MSFLAFETDMKHLLFTAAYLGLSIYVQLAYVYGPMDILVGGWGLAVVAFIGAGTLSPIFVMVFDKAVRQNHFRSSCSKFILYTLIAAGCAIQLAFGVYVLINMGFNAWSYAAGSMNDLMQAWDATEVARDTDYFQSYFFCCGGVAGPSDWMANVEQFVDYATHFNATAKWPVPDGCLVSYDIEFPYESYLQGLYYNSTEEIWTTGCVEPVYEFLQANSEFILAPIIITVSSFELIFLTKSFLCGNPSESAQYLK